jgi:hypothetical protein
MAKRKDETLFEILEVSQAPLKCQPELRSLVREGHSLRGLIDRLDEVKARIAEIVVDEYGLISDKGQYGVRDGPNAVIVREQQGRETISKELLVENGVTPAQIAASMKRGKGFRVVEFQQMEAAD